MAVFRIEKTRDYTVMSNYHLRDRSLSLKAKGLLSLMLSLPEDWDYTMKGLARICKDGIDSISGGIRELEAHGYLVRARVRNENGQLGSIEYTILEQPKEPAQTPAPVREKPIRENPIQVKPMLDAPIQENPAQLNTKEQNKELSITQESSPIPSSPPMRNMVSRVIVKLPHQTSPKGDHIPHEKKYNTRHGLQAIPNEVRRKIWREPRQPEVQQEPVVHLFLETALGWKCGTGCGREATPAARRACSVSCAKWACFRQKSRKRRTNRSLTSR